MFTHIYTHTHSGCGQLDLSGQELLPRASPTVEHWESCAWFWSHWLSPDLASKYTAASRNSTLSSRKARHGKFRRNKKDRGGKKEAGKIYVLIPVCGSEPFLNAFNTLNCTGQSSPDEIFQIWKWKKKLHCNGSLWLYLHKSGITCCTVMTSYTARSLRLSCWITVFFRAGYHDWQRLRRNHGLWKHKAPNHMTFHSKNDLYSSLSVNVFWITNILLCKPADPAIVSMTQTRCSDTSADTRGVMTPCLTNSVCYCCSTL